MSPNTPLRLDDRYRVENGVVFMTGLQALVRLPLDAQRREQRRGRRTAAFISGYEGSPLAGYDLELNRHAALLAEHGVVFQPGVNEELAANAVQGTQLAPSVPGFQNDGVLGIWYGKAPGLDRASDALRHANLGGADPRGGVVVVVGDDSIAKSSTVPSSSEMAIAELGMPVISPADPQDVLDLGLHAFEMSRFSGLWVGMKVSTNVADGAATTEVDCDRVQVVEPSRDIDGKHFTHEVSANFLQPTLSDLERTLFGERIELARRYVVANRLNRIYGADDSAVVGIVVAGTSYLDVRQALGTLGLPETELQRRGVRLLKLGATFPLDFGEIRAFAEGLSEIVVVEEKRPFIEAGIKSILYGVADAPAISGKTDVEGPLLKQSSDANPDDIAAALHRVLSRHISVPSAPASNRRQGIISLPLLARTPFFCSGCPHSRSTRAPEGSLVGAGIGCSGMVTMMPSERVGEVLGLTQMGGEGATWMGIAPFVSRSHMLQNMGDGTYHHSGSLAIRAAVAAGNNITFKLLYNSAVAMTGGQQAVGVMTVPQIVRELLAEGVVRVIVTTEDPKRYRRVSLPRAVDVRHRDQLDDIQRELAETSGVTVLIHDQECATELRRKRKRKLAPDPDQRAFINPRVCEGCGDCGDKSGCLSVRPVATAYGRKTEIDQASCNKDYSCLDGDCPSFLTVTTHAGASGSRARPATPALTSDQLPMPLPSTAHRDFNMRVVGIGGTGVVTLAQIVASAASHAGRFVQTLDQTGLAQKGGAVVSDIRIADSPLEQANKIGAGQADLYLGCDVLASATESNLAVAAPQRTIAVVSTAQTPTGDMIVRPDIEFPSPTDTVDRIRAVTRAADSSYVDARALSKQLFDDDQFSNILLLGVAFQAGALPLDSDAIERAIELNGVRVETNIQAFRRGRQVICDADGLARVLDPATTADRTHTSRPVAHELAQEVQAEAGSHLAMLVENRAGELIRYQNRAYAQRYLRAVERVRRAEADVKPGSTELTEAAAFGLHKLMAYKDEYEVARLSVDPELRRLLTAEFGEGHRASYRLHPPVLRALGLKKKLTLGPWFTPFLRALSFGRHLRHTPLDPFGYAKVRRTERSLVTEYEGLLTTIVEQLAPANHAVAVEIAALPDLIRGYEDIKLRNVDIYHNRLSDLTGRLVAPALHDAANDRSTEEV